MTKAALDYIVRRERSSDVPFVRSVVEAAFGRSVEADIVDAIRGTDDWLPEGSIVAVDELQRVVGHVLLSRGRLVAAGGEVTDIGMIGPVAVLPDLQGRGIGSLLMRAAISAAVARRFPLMCLVGHPSYYPRFGFEPARPLGIEAPSPGWPDEAWMALRLPAYTPALRGIAHFPPAFGEE